MPEFDLEKLVTSVSNSDSTLSITPTVGDVVASLALSHANTWTANQTFHNILTATDNTYTIGTSATKFSAVYAYGLGIPINTLNYGLVGYWPFDEGSGTSAYDLSGSGRTGTLSSSHTPTWVIGKFGDAISSDNFGYVQSTDVGLPSGSAARSFFAWVYITAYGTTGRIAVDVYGTNSVNNEFASFQIDQTGVLYFGGYNDDAEGTITVPLNTWSLIGYTYVAAATQMTLYVNGVGETKTFLYDSAALNTVLTGTHIIGPNASNDKGIEIDDARFYNRALSAAEVLSLYNAPPTYPLIQQIALTDTGTQTLDYGLVGYWPLDEGSGTLVYDLSGNGNTGTLTNGPTWVTGKFGNALAFVTASSQYVNLNSTTGFPTGANPRTVTAWVYPTSFANQIAIMGYGGGGADTGYILAIAATSGYLQMIFISDTQTSTLPLTLNAWNFVAATYNGGTAVTLYVGSLSSVVNAAGTLNTGVSAGAWIGQRQSSTYFQGDIDDVRLYNRALSTWEVLNLYNSYPERPLLQQIALTNTGTQTLDYGLVGYWPLDEGSGTSTYDLSGSGNTGTLINSPTWATGKFGNALSLVGASSQYVSISNPSTLSAYSTVTVSLWLYTSTPSQTSYFFNYLKDNNNRIGLYLSGSNINAVEDVAATTYVLTGTTPMLANTWYHIIYVVDPSVAGHKLYLNGILQETQNYGTAWSDIGTAASLAIGAYIGVQYVTGTIDDVRIYNRALSTWEVLNLYNSYPVSPFINNFPIFSNNNIPYTFWMGYGANTNWPFSAEGIGDGSYIDSYLIFNSILGSTATRGSPTFTNLGTLPSYYIGYDGRTGTLRFGYGGAGTNISPTEVFRMTTTPDLQFATKFSKYNNLATTGTGLPIILRSYSATGLSAAQQAFTYTPPALAGTYLISANVTVVLWTTPASFQVKITYKDSYGIGHSADVMPMFKHDATLGNPSAIETYYGVPMIFEIYNDSTAITCATVGTFTGSPTYLFTATLIQLA